MTQKTKKKTNYYEHEIEHSTKNLRKVMSFSILGGFLISIAFIAWIYLSFKV